MFSKLETLIDIEEQRMLKEAYVNVERECGKKVEGRRGCGCIACCKDAVDRYNFYFDFITGEDNPCFHYKLVIPRFKPHLIKAPNTTVGHVFGY